MSLLVKRILFGFVSLAFAGGIIFGVVKYIERSATTEERLRTIQEERTIQDRVGNAIRTTPRSVEDALEYLRNR